MRGAETYANDRRRSLGGLPSGRGFPRRTSVSPERTGCQSCDWEGDTGFDFCLEELGHF